MNKADRLARRKQMAKLLDKLNHWLGDRETPCTATLMREFDGLSKEIELSLAEKLSVFTSYMHDRIPWKDLSTLFEWWLELEDEPEHNGIYAVWFTLALSSEQNEDLALPERRAAAETALEILERDDFDESAEYAFSYGQVLYHHPDKMADTDKYCRNALQWLDQAREISSKDEDSSHLLQCIDDLRADTYYELGEWSDAIKLYEQLTVFSDDSRRKEIESRIRVAKEKKISTSN